MAGTWDFGNFRFWKNDRVHFFNKKHAKNDVLKNPVLPGSIIPLLATHKIISHIWEDRSRKVNNDQPGFRFFHGSFWPVISQAVRKPCFSTSIPRGPDLYILDFRRRRQRLRRRHRTNSQIQIQAPPNAPRDEIIRKGNVLGKLSCSLWVLVCMWATFLVWSPLILRSAGSNRAY